MRKNLQHNNPPLVISAYSVFPMPNSAEAIVNAALIDALAQHFRIALATSKWGYRSVAPDRPQDRGNVALFTGPSLHPTLTFADRMALWLRLPKTHPLGVIARAIDRIRLRILARPSYLMTAWANGAARQISRWLQSEFRGAVVWARGTPPDSFEAAITAYREKPFPLVANYNDPMPRSVLFDAPGNSADRKHDQIQLAQNSFLAQHAQAWTFPSRRLLLAMQQKANFDPARCFVLPHMVPGAFSASSDRSQDQVIAYAGTAYPSVFTEEVMTGISLYAQSKGKLRFRFILKKPAPHIQHWAEHEVAGADTLYDLTPSQVEAHMSSASAVLVVEEKSQGALLRTKVVEALHLRKPIIAIAPADSTTADVVRAASGIVCDPGSRLSIAYAFEELEAALATNMPPPDNQTLDRFSPGRIAGDAQKILDYASARFAWSNAPSGPEPQPPQIECWP